MRCIISLVISLFVVAYMVTLTPRGVCAGLLDDAVGVWLLNESSGTTVHDTSGNENHGEMRGGSGKWVKGKFGNALQLNGTSEFVEVPDSDSLDLEEQVTMVCWFNWEGSGDGWQTFFSKGPMSGPNENYALFINNGGRHTHFCTNAGGRNCLNSPNNAFEPNKWHHTAATYDGKRKITYLDGKEVQNDPLSGKMVTNDNYLGIGFREGSSHYWKGMLDDMAIFKRALSADEVVDIMENGLEAIAPVRPDDKLAATWGKIKVR
ncbi:TPA: LamG domain-containing protein [Candidatus Poribacteria bacterium]|nr:LamG domain-containing protein [Candidatus Poribacteria bacterium]